VALAQEKTLGARFFVTALWPLRSSWPPSSLNEAYGTVSMERKKQKAFVREDPTLCPEPARNRASSPLGKSWLEEARIRNVAIAGRNRHESLGQGKAWIVTDRNLDAGQLAAVEFGDVPTGIWPLAIAGKPGAGKVQSHRSSFGSHSTSDRRQAFRLSGPALEAVEAVREAAAAEDAMTVDRLRVDPRLQKEAAGRVLFCDEASFLDNARAEWLFDLCQGPSLPGCFLGGPAPGTMRLKRGTPFADLLDEQTLARAESGEDLPPNQPSTACRGRGLPRSAGLEAGFDRLEQAKMIRGTRLQRRSLA